MFRASLSPSLGDSPPALFARAFGLAQIADRAIRKRDSSPLQARQISARKTIRSEFPVAPHEIRRYA
jgi:hypothetical protein